MYTERDSKIGFGLERKLPIIDDRRLKPSWSVLINTNQFAIVDYRGFGQAENPIFESRSVYSIKTSERSLNIYKTFLKKENSPLIQLSGNSEQFRLKGSAKLPDRSISIT